MEAVKKISYQDTATGRKVIPVPPELPFASCREELESIVGSPEWREEIVRLAEGADTYEIASRLASHLVIAEHPHRELLRILLLAVSGESAAMSLLYGALLAVPPTPILVGRLAGFTSLRRVMERIEQLEAAGSELDDAQKWFKQKVMFLSLSKPLPDPQPADPQRPWTGWREGVARAVADPDDRWEEAITERLKIEIEASDLRVRTIVARIDPETTKMLGSRLEALSQENRFMTGALGEAGAAEGASPLLLRRRLENIWDSLVAGLRESRPGTLLAEILVSQEGKTHSLPQLRTGAAVIRSVLSHPELRKTTKVPDLPSCLYLYVCSAGGGLIEMMVPRGPKLEVMRDSAGFAFDERLMRIDLTRISRSAFVGDDGIPVDIDWTMQTLNRGLSYRAMVLSYIDNDTFLISLLNNPKACSKPGVVSLIAARCRSLRVLSLLAGRREFFTGHANKDVPLYLLMNPAKVPLTGLRKFIHVRYVDRMTLQKLSAKGGGNIREEVRREIVRYLASIH